MNVSDRRTPTGAQGTDARALPPRARRTARSERADVRRRALLEAALSVIGREGIDAVSHRRVAEVAGVPLGSTTYYFASREDMLVQTLEYFARGEIDALRRALGEVTAAEWAQAGPAGLVERLFAFLAPQLGESGWRTLAQYTLFSEAARRPELRPVAGEWNEEWWAILADVLGALGRPDARLEAQMLLAMLDGLLLVGIAEPRADFAETVLRPALERWLGL